MASDTTKKSARKKLTKQQLVDAEFASAKFARRRNYLAAFVFAIACTIGWQADRLLDVHVKKVQIEGELSAAERQAVMGTISGAIEASGAAGLHSLSLDEVRAAIAQLSWADQVSARRRWPDTLVVQLVRHTVVARWGGGGLVASNGEVVTPPKSEVSFRSDLPLLNCQEASARRAMEVFNVLSRTLGATDLRLIELNESLLGEWTAGIADPGVMGANTSTTPTAATVHVALGGDDLAARLQRFLAVRSEIATSQKNSGGDSRSSPLMRIASVDARYHNGVAVRFREPEAALATILFTEDLSDKLELLR